MLAAVRAARRRAASRSRDALGRVLAEDVTSAIDVPPFDSSAMDGFALVAGPRGRLRGGRRVARRAPARARLAEGDGGAHLDRRGACRAARRRGAGRAHRARRTARVRGARRPRPGANVRRAGEDLRAGDVVLRARHAARPAELGVAASVGRAELAARAGRGVALLVTGRRARASPASRSGRARSTARTASRSRAQIARGGRRAGSARARCRTAPRARARRSRQALAARRRGVVSGGVSVGPHDHVKGALRELGVEERFWGVALRPASRPGSARAGDVLAFGLPGNPVSAMVTFQLFARPALRRPAGRRPRRPARAARVLDEPVRAQPAAASRRCACG